MARGKGRSHPARQFWHGLSCQTSRRRLDQEGTHLPENKIYMKLNFETWESPVPVPDRDLESYGPRKATLLIRRTILRRLTRKILQHRTANTTAVPIFLIQNSSQQQFS